MNTLYVGYFVFLYVSIVITRLSMTSFQSTDYWTKLSCYENLSAKDKQLYALKTRHILYWLNADRFYWRNDDLHNLAEAFFALGNVFSICRICFLVYLAGFDTFVSNLGCFIYEIFTFICVTVLINTLIGMLEETIDEIDDRADIEWEFARSKLYMEYIRDGKFDLQTKQKSFIRFDLGNSLPVPLNIIPSPASIIRLYEQM